MKKFNFTSNQIATFISAGAAILACIICGVIDAIMNGGLTWSSVVIYSLITAMIVAAPSLWLGWRGLPISLISLTILCIPFVYILSVVLNSEDVFSIGWIVALVIVVSAWIFLVVTRRFSDRPQKVASIAFLLLSIIAIVINVVIIFNLKLQFLNLGSIIAFALALILAVIGLAYLSADQKKYPKARPVVSSKKISPKKLTKNSANNKASIPTTQATQTTPATNQPQQTQQAPRPAPAASTTNTQPAMNHAAPTAANATGSQMPQMQPSAGPATNVSASAQPKLQTAPTAAPNATASSQPPMRPAPSQANVPPQAA